MEIRFLTLDDFETSNKTVFVRVDINVPLDPSTNQILDDTRIKSTQPTLEALPDARVVVSSHQSRPGMADFTSLEAHAALLRKYCRRKVSYVEDVVGPEARREIKALRPGEILVLDNLRLCAEENIEDRPEKLASTLMVQRLGPLFDFYVNDAFAASHRSQPSLVGLPHVLPACAGRLMERELSSLGRLLGKPARPTTYILGGAKIEDKIPVISNILNEKKADYVLLGGVVAKVFLAAKGHGQFASELSDSRKAKDVVGIARQLLEKFRERIALPDDFAIEKNTARVDVAADSLRDDQTTLDIGSHTAEKYRKIIAGSKTVVASGPLGVFERNGFDMGTRTVLETMSEVNGFTVIGGGHLTGYAGILGIERKFSHVSTAGGAMLSLLAGEELPAIKALVEAAQRHRQ